MTIVLALITFCASLALGFVYKGTEPMIEEQRMMAEEEARRVALPEAMCGVMVPRENKGVEYYEGYRFPDTTGLVGYTIKASAKGYSSTIEAVVGVAPDGSITGMKIISQQETPGLGTKIEEVKSFKSVLDALKELMGTAELQTVRVTLPVTGGQDLCLDVGIKDAPRCGELEMAVASDDTSGIVTMAPKTFKLDSADSAVVFGDAGLSVELTEAVLAELRRENTPWFQYQFIGKRYDDLVLVRGQTDRNIQGITGATISSTAVLNAVKKAIANLDKAVGGLRED
jgi:RnfABCDGE-type electron transport complex G subunit